MPGTMPEMSSLLLGIAFTPPVEGSPSPRPSPRRRGEGEADSRCATSGRPGQLVPGTNHRIRIQPERGDALVLEPLREVGVVGGPLAADADIFASLLAGHDRCWHPTRRYGMLSPHWPIPLKLPLHRRWSNRSRRRRRRQSRHIARRRATSWHFCSLASMRCCPCCARREDHRLHHRDGGDEGDSRSSG